MKTKKKYTNEDKIKILREHLENNVPMSELSEKYGVAPSAIYLWKKLLFENSSQSLNKKTNKREEKRKSALEHRIAELESTLAIRESLISELLLENVDLKKNLNGGRLIRNGLNRK
jgi:transposase-like protein